MIAGLPALCFRFVRRFAMSLRNTIDCVAVVMAAAMFISTAEAAPSKGKSKGKGGGVTIGAGGEKSQQQLQSALQNIDKQIQDGQKSFSEASKKAQETQRNFQQAAQAHKQDQRQLSQIKKLAETEAKNDPDWKSARAKADDLRDQLAKVRMRVVTSIKNNDEYQAAIKTREEAVAARAAASSTEVADDVRKTLTKNVSASDQAIRLLEDVAMANHSEAKGLTQQLQAADADVAAASKRRRDSIENDPQLTSAKSEFVRSYQVQKAAEQQHAQTLGEANRIQSGLQALNSQKAAINSQIQLMQKMQSGGGGNKSNNKGKK